MANAVKSLVQNRKARHDYFIEDKYEAGIQLLGVEVKSIRQGKANLKDSYAAFHAGELYIYGMHISPYEQGNINNKDPMRPKKLLMHKRELRKLIGLVQQEGFSLIPLQIYLSHGLIKAELALAKGKKLYDKRHVLAEKSAKRDIERSLRQKG